MGKEAPIINRGKSRVKCGHRETQDQADSPKTGKKKINGLMP